MLYGLQATKGSPGHKGEEHWKGITMKLRNDSQRFGAIALLFHWLVALAVIGLFAIWRAATEGGLSWLRIGQKHGAMILSHPSLEKTLMNSIK